MCLASRLCTQANLGNMTNRREIAKMIIGNIALVQIQAIVAALCLSLFGMGVGSFNGNGFVWNDALLLAVSCMCTATSSCFILGKLSSPAGILIKHWLMNVAYALIFINWRLHEVITRLPYLSAINISNDCYRGLQFYQASCCTNRQCTHSSYARIKMCCCLLYSGIFHHRGSFFFFFHTLWMF